MRKIRGLGGWVVIDKNKKTWVKRLIIEKRCGYLEVIKYFKATNSNMKMNADK